MNRKENKTEGFEEWNCSDILGILKLPSHLHHLVYLTYTVVLKSISGEERVAFCRVKQRMKHMKQQMNRMKQRYEDSDYCPSGSKHIVEQWSANIGLTGSNNFILIKFGQFLFPDTVIGSNPIKRFESSLWFRPGRKFESFY